MAAHGGKQKGLTAQPLYLLHQPGGDLDCPADAPAAAGDGDAHAGPDFAAQVKSCQLTGEFRRDVRHFRLLIVLLYLNDLRQIHVNQTPFRCSDPDLWRLGTPYSGRSER